jgi:hypothetical protein
MHANEYEVVGSVRVFQRLAVEPEKNPKNNRKQSTTSWGTIPVIHKSEFDS